MTVVDGFAARRGILAGSSRSDGKIESRNSCCRKNREQMRWRKSDVLSRAVPLPPVRAGSCSGMLQD